MKTVNCTKENINLYELITSDSRGTYFICIREKDLKNKTFSVLRYSISDHELNEIEEDIVYQVQITDDYVNNKYSVAYVIQLALDWNQEDVFFRGMDFWDNSDEQMKEEAEKAYRFLWAHEHMLKDFNRDGMVDKPKPGYYGTSISSLR